MIAIVTGGTRGIGFSISNELLNIGYTVIASSRNNTEEWQNVMNNNQNADFFSCDIKESNDRLALVDYAIKKYGNIDLLVNNAGVAPKNRLDMLDITEDDFDYVIDINLKGTYFLSQLVANYMKNNSSGRIINISSMSSYTASTNRAEYCISKAGISMITKLFAVRMAEYGVGVFEVAPGIIETDMTSKVKDKYQQMIDNGLTPIKRLGSPIDIAKCVVAIANGNLDFCIGNVINADGGFSVRKL